MNDTLVPYTRALKTEIVDDVEAMFAKLSTRMTEQLEAGLKRVCDMGAANAGARPAITAQRDQPEAQTHKPGFDPNPNPACRTYASEVQRATQKMCNGLIRDECDLALIDDAANASAYPLIEKHLGRTLMTFVPTGAQGTGLNADGEPTVFKADYSIAPGQSILLQQDPSYPLHWRPGCLIPSVKWTEGEDQDNYKGLRITVWVAMKSQTFTTNIATPVGKFGEKWNEWQVIDGSELYCDGCTKEVAITGPTGCDVDVVGREAKLLLQIDNLGDGDQPITKTSFRIKFAGFKEACCDSCKSGKSCGGSCGVH